MSLALLWLLALFLYSLIAGPRIAAVARADGLDPARYLRGWMLPLGV